MTVKIASWNVNSLRVRLPHVLEWLERAAPDVLALQETKLPDDQFPRSDIEAAGYRVEHFYYLARAALVKDERKLDRFDRVFAYWFQGMEEIEDPFQRIPEEWLKAWGERVGCDVVAGEAGGDPASVAFDTEHEAPRHAGIRCGRKRRACWTLNHN